MSIISNFAIVLYIYTLIQCIKCLDQLPFQVSSNVYLIQENNAIVYKSQSDQNWRYSSFDQSGNLTNTYLLKGFIDLNQFSFYFIQNNNQIYFSGFGLSNYMILDVNLLTNNQPNFLVIQQFKNHNFGCSGLDSILNYGQYYFYICMSGYYLQESSFNALLTTQSRQSFQNTIRARQTYLLFQNQFLVYKNVIYTNLQQTKSSDYLLVDLQNDLFLQDNQLCKAQMNQKTSSFSCSKTYNLGVSTSNTDYSTIVLSKVFQSNGMSIICAYNYSSNQYVFFNALTLNIINTTGSSIISPITNQDIFQINVKIIKITIFQAINLTKKNQIYIQTNMYTATYDSTTQMITINLITSSLGQNYYISPNAPFYYYNFQYVNLLQSKIKHQKMLNQKGNTLYLQQGSNQYLISINSIYQYCPQFCNQCQNQQQCQICNDGYLLNNQFQCQQCPTSDFQLDTNNDCVCKNNMSLQNNSSSSCVCNPGYSRDTNNICQSCPQFCLQCNTQQQCTQCNSGYLLNSNKQCQSCPSADFQLDQNDNCVCKQNMILQGKQCECNQGYSKDANNVCQQCSPNCLECDMQQKCQKCQSDYIVDSQSNCVCKQNMIQDNGACVCIQGYSKNSNDICVQCPTYCSQCDTQQKCLVCNTGYYLQLDSSCNTQCPPSSQINSTNNNQCICDLNATIVQNINCQCNQNFYLNGNKCIQCIDNCVTCQNQTTCQLCQTSYTISPSGQCQFCDTKNGFFIKDNQCLSCQKTNCLECSNQNQCTKYAECGAQFTYNYTTKQCEQCLWDLQSQQCVDSCDQTYQYFDQTQKTCSQCYYLNQQCQKSCPKGYYQDDKYNCLQCNSSCKSCNGPKQNQCTNCNQNYYLQSDQSCSQCQDGYFLDQISGQCKTCNINCQTCNGTQSNNCLSCSEGLQLSQHTNECLSQSKIDSQSEQILKLSYSNCDQTSYDCSSLSSISDLIQKLSLGLLITFLITFALQSFFSCSANVIGWYSIQIFQLLGNLAFDANMNIFWMNIGFLKGFLSYNVFNLVSDNSFQKTQDLLIDFNQYQIGIQIQNLYKNFIENSFYQLIGLVVVFSILLLSCLLKKQLGSLNRLYEYMNISGVIRYFMIASNFILLYSFYSIKQQNYTSQGNIYFIAIFGLIYFIIQAICFYGLSFNSFTSYSNRIQVLQEGIIQHKKLSKLFWIVFEIRKIVCVSSIVFLNKFQYCGIIMAASSLIFLIYLFIRNPIIKRSDQLVLFLTETFCIFLFIIFNLISNRNNWKISNQIATNLAIATLIIQLLIIRALDVLPIQIKNDLLFIVEKNALIYQASSDSNYRYSTLDTQGIITATYLLNGIQKIDKNTRYFIMNNVLYLNYYQSQSYHTIDLNIMNSGQTGYLQTLQYPKATNPCATSEIMIQGIANVYYYMCFDSYNIFLLQSSTFQGIFNTQNSYSSSLGIRNEYTHIVLDNQLFTNGTIQSTDFICLHIRHSINQQDYLTKVSTINSIFQDVSSVKLNNSLNIDELLISDIINFTGISIIFAYDFQKQAFRYFDAQNLQELQSTGANLPFVNYKTFLQYQNFIFIGTSQYTLTYIASSKQVNIALNSNTLSNSYTLPYYHTIYYAFSYQLIYQVYSGSTQYLINIIQSYNFCVPGCQTCSSITVCAICQSPLYLDNKLQCVSSCPAQFVPDNTKQICICRSNSTLLNQNCPCNLTYFDKNGVCMPCPQNCNTCTSLTICSSCQAGYYLAADGTCVSTCPLNFSPDQTNTNCVCRQNSTLQNLKCSCNTGYTDINGVCQQCPLNCDVCISQSVCSQCSKNYYLTLQGLCTSSCPQTFIIDSTLKKCVCDAKMILLNNQMCISCDQTCQTCFGSSQYQCTSCYNGYLLINSECQQIYLVQQQQQSSQNYEQKYQNSTQMIVFQGSVYTSYASSLAQTILSSQSFSLFFYGIIISKLSYLILVNTNYPIEVFLPLKNLKNQLPSQQMQVLNIIQNLNEDTIKYYDSKFYSADLPYNLIYNSGQGIILCIICLTFFLMFYFLIEKENNAIVYKSQSDQTWRYSSFDQNGNLTNTYLLKGFIDLNEYTFYFIQNVKHYQNTIVKVKYSQQNNQLYFSGFGLSNYMILDVNLLTNNQPNFLVKKQFQNPNFGCSNEDFIGNYGQYYFYICLDGFYLQELSVNALFTTQSSQSFYNTVRARQTYLLFENQLLVYKNVIYTNLQQTKSTDYLLVDLQNDLFLQDNQLCKAQMNQKTSSFSCSKTYNLGVSTSNTDYSTIVLSKVFQSNGMSIICAYNYSSNQYVFFNASTLNIINTTGSSIISPKTNQDIFQINNQIYIQTNMYTATYDSITQMITINLITSSLGQNYYISPNAPFYYYNFQYGNTLYLQQGSNQYLININSIYQYCPQFCNQCQNQSQCQICNDGYLLNNQFQCQQCPTPDFQLDTNNNCVCKNNMSLQNNNSCVCNPGYSKDTNNICQSCPQYCLQCNTQQQCTQCNSGYLLNSNKQCQQCPSADFQLDSNDNCVCKPNMISQGNQCECNQGYSKDANNICQQCPPNCLECDVQQKCQKCQSDYIVDSQSNCVCKQNMIQDNGACVCIQGYSKNSNDICVQCPTYCSQCDTQQKCLVCNTSYYLQLDSSCNTQCPPSSQINSTNNNQCICDLNATIVQNINCQCNQNFYLNGNKCIQCIDNCVTCQNQTTCQLCQTNYTILPSGQCQFCDTKNGFFIKDNQCLSCQKTNCLECSNQNQCTKYADCGAQSIYNYNTKQCEQCLWDLQSQKCVDNCDQTYQYYDQTQKTCSQCYYINQQCQKSCPKGYYQDDKYNCLQCNSSCKTCNGPKQNQCTSCNQNYYLQSDQSCSQCQDGYFLDQISGQCKTCNINCQTCNGTQSNNCLSCSEGLQLSQHTNECLSQSKIDSQSEQILKLSYSNCDQTSYDCSSLSSISDLIQKLSLGLLITFLITFALQSFFSCSSNVLGWYSIQILQLLGNLAFDANMNIFWMNIGFLKGFLSYNLFNLVSDNSFQKAQDLLIDFNQYQIGIQIQSLYKNFIENSFYQLIGLVVVFSILLLSCLLKNQLGSLSRLYEYMNISGVIRYFMIASNFILLYSFYSIKQQNYTSQGNIYFIAIFGLIYFIIQAICFYGLSFNSFASYSNKIQVLQEGIIQHKKLSKLFWIIFEIRKIVCVSSIVFLNKFEYCGIIMASTSLLFFIYLFIKNPIIKRSDQLVMFLTETVCIVLFIIFNLISNRNNWKINNQIATNLAIVFIILSLSLSLMIILLFLINIYQFLKAYIINRNRQSIIQKDKQPVMQQFQVFNSLKDIEYALSSTLNNSKQSKIRLTKKIF
ncbi:hypothetical protein ABPG74_020760 [Tetrahymena malaccensis]